MSWGLPDPWLLWRIAADRRLDVTRRFLAQLMVIIDDRTPWSFIEKIWKVFIYCDFFNHLCFTFDDFFKKGALLLWCLKWGIRKVHFLLTNALHPRLESKWLWKSCTLMRWSEYTCPSARTFSAEKGKSGNLLRNDLPICNGRSDQEAQPANSIWRLKEPKQLTWQSLKDPKNGEQVSVQGWLNRKLERPLKGQGLVTGWSSELSFCGMHMLEGPRQALFIWLMLLACVERDVGEAWGRGKHDFMNLTHLCGHGLFKSSKAAL